MQGSSEACSLGQSAPLGRVIVLTGSIGSGHTRAAEALREAMLRSRTAESVEIIDAMAQAYAPFRWLYKDAYLACVERAPTVVGWIYRSSDTHEGGGARRMLQRAALARLRTMIRASQPNTILCTHFLTAELVSEMIDREEWRGTFGVVVTDLDAHGLWAACPRADRWFVAIPEACEILAGKGVDRSKIVVTGIPIMGAFASPMPSREELRVRHGLPREGPVALVSGGGVGASHLDMTVRALLDADRELGVALVCGKNAALREAATNLVEAHGASARCAVFGFTDRMHELMKAADIAVGKPGGLTSSESLAMGLPMAIVRPLPGQEERNSDHLVEWGVAVRLNSPESLGWRLSTLLRDEDRLSRMRAAAKARALPFAADAVISALLEIRGKNTTIIPAGTEDEHGAFPSPVGAIMPEQVRDRGVETATTRPVKRLQPLRK
ncbi:MAG: glycosyltransferase [Limnohabitans sp.]|nr:glycosyltransferase [Limnohabitans sp.]